MATRRRPVDQLGYVDMPYELRFASHATEESREALVWLEANGLSGLEWIRRCHVWRRYSAGWSFQPPPRRGVVVDDNSRVLRDVLAEFQERARRGEPPPPSPVVG